MEQGWALSKPVWQKKKNDVPRSLKSCADRLQQTSGSLLGFVPVMH